MGKNVEVSGFEAESVALRIIADLAEGERGGPQWEDYPWFTEGAWAAVLDAIKVQAGILRRQATWRDEATRTDSLFIMQEAAN